MLTLDDDEADLALMALRYTTDAACAQSINQRTDSGCDGAAKACVDDFCLPRLRALIGRIQQHNRDVAEEKADGPA